MNILRAPRRLPPFASIFALLTAALLGGWCLLPEGHTQAPMASTPNASLSPLLAKLAAQQTALAANQTKIEAQTALLKEELRQAKIYSARGGAGRR